MRRFHSLTEEKIRQKRMELYIKDMVSWWDEKSSIHFSEQIVGYIKSLKAKGVTINLNRDLCGCEVCLGRMNIFHKTRPFSRPKRCLSKMDRTPVRRLTRSEVEGWQKMVNSVNDIIYIGARRFSHNLTRVNSKLRIRYVRE